MRNKKAIHDLLSPKIANKRKAKRAAAGNKDGDGNPVPPPSVNNFLNNKPLFGPHKIKKKPVEVKPRKIAKTEGKQTVNAKTNVDRFVHRPTPKISKIDPAAGAIDKVPDKKTKSSRGRKKKVNVNKQTKTNS